MFVVFSHVFALLKILFAEKVRLFRVAPKIVGVIDAWPTEVLFAY